MTSALRRAAALAFAAATTLSAQTADTVVRPATRPVHAGIAPLRQEISIGVADGDEHYMLGAIADIAVAPSGNIYLWDSSVPAIRMYNAAGKYLKTIGRQGGGPGEYQSGAAIAVAKNGNLLLWDPGNARINVYTATGDVVASWLTRSGGIGAQQGAGVMTVDTASFIYIRTIITRRMQGKPSSHVSGWIRFAPDGSLRDTLFAPPAAEQPYLRAEANGGRQISERWIPFWPTHHTDRSPLGYFVTGQSNRIALDLHEPGKPIASIRREVTLEPLSAKTRDSARAEVTKELRQTDPGWSWSGPGVPRTKPAYRALMVAADGRIWVELSQAPRAKEDSLALGRGQMAVIQQRPDPSGQPRPRPAMKWYCPVSGVSLFDVYEPSGQYLGQVEVPAKVDPVLTRGDFVWAATCSAEDVPIVVRYRIAWR